MNPVTSLKERALHRIADAVARRTAQPGDRPPAQVRALRRRLARVEQEVQESRQLNQRLSDVVDVVTELLVPALDRDDERVRQALERLEGSLQAGPPLSETDRQ